MANGYVLKLLENLRRASQNDVDLTEQIDAAKDMLQHGYDANDAQWQALNRKVDDLPRETQASGNDGQSSGVQGTHGNQQYVSGAKPGTPGNPIGYPGTDQDKDGPPGKGPIVVPGQKLTDDKA